MQSRYLRIDLSKNTKFIYYLYSILNLLTPKIFFAFRLKSILENIDNTKEIQERVNYYNKTSNFSLDDSLSNYNKFLKEKKKTYFFDLLRYLKYFPSTYSFSYLFGDIVDIPNRPTLLKSRPIDGNNSNSVIMKLNKIRHFIFVDDKISFEEKKDILVWRGKCYREHRVEFVKRYYDNNLCNIGQTNTKGNLNVPWQKNKLSLKEQLKYKFILAIEGNDVASNLKWVMSSNSLAFMCKPKYETWFMEGTLVANHHYVLLKDDYSDLEEKVKYYSKHTTEAKKIVVNANKHVEQFKNTKREKIISLLVLQKYFKNSGQIND